MRKTLMILVGLVVVGLPLLRYADAQRRSYGGSRALYTQQLLRRMDTLEQRVSALERVVGQRVDADPQVLTGVTLDRAEQQVATAQQSLEFSEALFRKGYISRAELEASRFDLRRANKVREFAEAVQSGAATDEIASEIEILDAEYHLAVARRQMELARRVAAKGFASSDAVAAHEKAVADAEERLEKAQAPQP